MTGRKTKTIGRPNMTDKTINRLCRSTAPKTIFKKEINTAFYGKRHDQRFQPIESLLVPKYPCHGDVQIAVTCFGDLTAPDAQQLSVWDRHQATE